MPYSIQWYIEGQVLLIRFHGVVTVQEMERYADSLLPFYAQTDAPKVHALVDVRYMTRSLTLVDLIKLLQRPLHPRMGWNIQLETHRQTWLRSLTGVLTRILGIRSYSCTSLDDGLTFLASQDDSIHYEKASLSVLNPDFQNDSNHTP